MDTKLDENSNFQNLSISQKEKELPGLEESIKLAYEAFESAIQSNNIENAIAMVEPYAHISLYHNSLKSLFIILNAALTLEKVNHLL